MDIQISGEPHDGRVLMAVVLNDDQGEDKPLQTATIELWVDFDDSYAKLVENTYAELATFLNNAIEAIEDH